MKDHLLRRLHLTFLNQGMLGLGLFRMQMGAKNEQEGVQLKSFHLN